MRQIYVHKKLLNVKFCMDIAKLMHSNFSNFSTYFKIKHIKKGSTRIGDSYEIVKSRLRIFFTYQKSDLGPIFLLHKYIRSKNKDRYNLIKIFKKINSSFKIENYALIQ